MILTEHTRTSLRLSLDIPISLSEPASTVCFRITRSVISSKRDVLIRRSLRERSTFPSSEYHGHLAYTIPRNDVYVSHIDMDPT